MDFIDERFKAWWESGIVLVASPNSGEKLAREAFRAGCYLGVYQPRPAAAAAAENEVPVGPRAAPYLQRGGPGNG